MKSDSGDGMSMDNFLVDAGYKVEGVVACLVEGTGAGNEIPVALLCTPALFT